MEPFRETPSTAWVVNVGGCHGCHGFLGCLSAKIQVLRPVPCRFGAQRRHPMRIIITLGRLGRLHDNQDSQDEPVMVLGESIRDKWGPLIAQPLAARDCGL